MPLGSHCRGCQGSPAPGGASRGGQGPPQPLRQPPAWTSPSHPASGSSLCQHNPLPSRGLFCSIGQLGAVGTDGTIPGYPSGRPPAADDLVSGKSVMFLRSRFNGAAPWPQLPHAAGLPETCWCGWRLKGKLQGSAIRSYRMRALSNCPQLETVPLLRHVFRQEAELGRSPLGKPPTPGLLARARGRQVSVGCRSWGPSGF